MAISWLGKSVSLCYVSTGADPSIDSLGGMDKVGYRASLSDTEHVTLTRHVATSTGRRIASRLDRPGHGRSMALVRSTSLATSTYAHKNLLSFIKSILLSGQDRRRRFMVHFYPPSVPSSLSPLRPTDEKHSNVFLDIRDHVS